jgi:phenylacetate-coenzyme A ligase PaaK-like adenylate-forming protein
VTDVRVVEAAQRAATRFPWYARMLADSGEVPTLREDDLATTYYAATDSPPGADSTPGEKVYLTSGTSTGVRKRVRWSAADHERYVHHRASLFASRFGDSCVTAAADLGTGHAQASAAEIFAAVGLQGRDIDVAWPIERHVECLAEWQPDLLYTMPMILERLVAASGPGGLGYVPEWIVVLGDLAPPAWRAAMEQRLGMQPGRILDVFGSIEVGAIAYSDERVGGYLFHDHIVPEALDDGLLALTSLERDAFPVVRYVSGDVIEGLRQVTLDGRVRWAYDRHLGREGAEIKHGEMLSLYTMADAIGATAPGVAWSVRREGLEVVIELDERGYSAEIAAAVRRAVREAHPAVDVMIRSGLVGDIAVEPRVFPDGTAKRQITTVSVATGE